MNRLKLTIAAILLTASPLFAVTKSELEDSFCREDDIALFEKCFDYIKSNDDAESFLLLNDLYNLKDSAGIKKTKDALKEIALLSEKRNHGNLLKLKSCQFIDRIDEESSFAPESEFRKIYNPLTKWRISETFKKYGNSDLKEKFTPESASKETKWRSADLKDGSGFFRSEDYSYRDGIVYLTTDISFEKSAKLRVESDSEYKLFINGREIIENSRKKIFRNERVISLKGSGAAILVKFRCHGKLRITLTSSDDAPVNYTYKPEKKDSEGVEILDHPYEDLAKAGDSYSQGVYFMNLGSIESLGKLTPEKNPSPLHRFILAAESIRAGREYDISSLREDGWRTITEMDDPSFIPLQCYKARRMIDRGEKREAISLLEKIIGKTPRYASAHYILLDLYREEGFDSLYLNGIKRFRESLPDSISPDGMLAEHIYGKNREDLSEIINSYCEKGILISPKLLSDRRSPHSNDYLKSMAEHGHKRELALYASNLIDSKNYSEARKLLISGLADKDDPEILYLLGRIEFENGREPDMYWRKISAIDPTLTFGENYFNYLEKKRVAGSFEELRDYTAVRKKIDSFLKGENGEKIRYRSLIHRIENGIVRTFKEELIHIKDERDIDRYGEYKLGFGKGFRIISSEVYSRDGSLSESFELQESNRRSYISIRGIAKDTLLHIAYEYLEDESHLNGSALTYIDGVMQNYDEDIEEAHLKIIAPKNRSIYVTLSDKSKMSKSESGDSYIYSADYLNIRKIEKESFSSGNFENTLHYAVTDYTEDDFFNWYRGYYPSSDIYNPGISFSGDKSDIIKKVYDYLSQNIETTGSIYFYPGEYSDTEREGRGSCEDKVLLARELLSRAGIISYPSLVKKDEYFPYSFSSRKTYKGILLCIPYGETKLWLDFSNKHLPFGSVSPSFEGCFANVIGGSSSTREIVKPQIDSSESNEITVDLKSREVTIKSEFKGYEKRIKAYFRNRSYVSDNVTRLYSSMKGSYILKNYTLTDSPEFYSISSKGELVNSIITSGSSIIFSPFLLDSPLNGFPLNSERKNSLYITEKIDLNNSYTFILPEGFSGRINDYEKRIESLGARIFCSVKAEGRLVKVTQRIYLPRMKVEVKDYPEFLKLLKDVNEIEKMKVRSL